MCQSRSTEQSLQALLGEPHVREAAGLPLTWWWCEATFLKSQQPTDVWRKQMGQLHAAELTSSFRSGKTNNPKNKVGSPRQNFEFARSWTKHSSESLRFLLVHLDGWDHSSVIPQNSLFYTPTDSAYNLPRTKFPLPGPPARGVLALGHSLCLYQTIHVCLDHSPGTSLKLSEGRPTLESTGMPHKI